MLCRPVRWLTISAEPVQLSNLCTLNSADQPPLVSAVSVTMPHKYVYRPTDKTEFVASSAEHLELLLSCMDVDHTFAVHPPAESNEAPEPDQPPINPPSQPHLYANGDTPHSNGNITNLEGGDAETEEEGDPEKEAWRTATKAKKKVFMRASMLWAFKAHQRAKHRSKLSLLTFGAQRPVPEMKASGGQRVSASAAASLALSRTLHMENKASCGPAIDIWPPEAPLKAEVRSWDFDSKCRSCLIMLTDFQSFGQAIFVRWTILCCRFYARSLKGAESGVWHYTMADTMLSDWLLHQILSSDLCSQVKERQ